MGPSPKTLGIVFHIFICYIFILLFMSIYFIRIVKAMGAKKGGRPERGSLLVIDKNLLFEKYCVGVRRETTIG
jgi:hypothetical protein